MVKRANYLVPAILLSLAGLFASYILTEEFYFSKFIQSSGDTPALFSQISSSVCGDESSFINCSKVSESEYARFFHIPIAVYGIFFFTVLALVSFWIFFSSEPLLFPSAVLFFWLAAIGSLLDVVLLLISLIKIKAICPFCISTYIVNWLLLGGAVFFLWKNRVTPFAFVQIFKSLYLPKKNSPAVKNLIATVLILSVSAGLSLVANTYLKIQSERYEKTRQDKELAAEATAIINRFLQEKEIDMEVVPLMVVGDPKAPITIVSYSDFLCPHCGKSAAVIDTLVQNNPSKVKAIFVNYPLDITCNHFMKREMHPGSCLLGLGAICAAEQGRFDAYHKTAFSMKLKNADWQTVIEAAGLSGISEPQFSLCMEDPQTRAELLREIEEAKKNGVKSTPTLFINKKRYQGKTRLDILQSIIDMEIKAVETK